MKNKYIYKSHITESKFREILRYFSQDFDAFQCSQLTKLTRKTINKLYHTFRVRIYQIEENQSSKINGEIKVNESYFGARRVRGKKGRGALGKVNLTPLSRPIFN